MTNQENQKRWRPSMVTLIAGVMVSVGIILPTFTTLSNWFFALAALGTFGPGMLRELGWLRDKDEFQLESARRAGYHAFLVTGFVAFVLFASLESSEQIVKYPKDFAGFFLSLLWFTWFFSSLLAYWGAQKTATLILCIFGSCWFIFLIAANVGSEWSGWTALLLHPLFVLPFFLMAWMARFWPRVAGALLIAVSIWLFWFLGMFRREMEPTTDALTFIFFFCPLLVNGIALACVSQKSDHEDCSDPQAKDTRH